MAHKVVVGEIEFKSKAKALDYCKKMLARYSDGDDINDAGDFKFLLSLIQRHPNAAQKIGPGVERFFKDKAEHGTSCFYVEQINGHKEHFSYQACITGRLRKEDDK